MKVWDEISEIVRRNLEVFSEIEALDTGFRRALDSDQRRAKVPWIMMGRDEFANEELVVWKKLDRGNLSEAEAITEIRSLMATYYQAV